MGIGSFVLALLGDECCCCCGVWSVCLCSQIHVLLCVHLWLRVGSHCQLKQKGCSFLMYIEKFVLGDARCCCCWCGCGCGCGVFVYVACFIVITCERYLLVGCCFLFLPQVGACWNYQGSLFHLSLLIWFGECVN